MRIEDINTCDATRFIELLGSLGIPAVDYDPEELADELAAARPKQA